MSLEIMVTIKDSERTFRQKFLIYEPVTFGLPVDPIIQKCIEESLENFQGDREDVDIVVRGTMIFQ